MRIQTIIPICRKTKQYARPASWKNQGRGVDLGKVTAGPALGIHEVRVINDSGAVFKNSWLPTPEELMERWELVDADTLWKESRDE